MPDSKPDSKQPSISIRSNPPASDEASPAPQMRIAADEDVVLEDGGEEAEEMSSAPPSPWSPSGSNLEQQPASSSDLVLARRLPSVDGTSLEEVTIHAAPPGDPPPDVPTPGDDGPFVSLVEAPPIPPPSPQPEVEEAATLAVPNATRETARDPVSHSERI